MSARLSCSGAVALCLAGCGLLPGFDFGGYVAGSGADSDSDSGADFGTEAATDSDVPPGPDAVSEAGGDARPDASANSGADASPDASANSGADASPDASADSGADASPDASADSGADASPDASAQGDAGDSGDGSDLDSGLCEPSQSFCNGSCVDEQTDGKNCGACEHDCLGGACSSGACQPVTLFAPPDGGQEAVAGLAVDANNVYFTLPLSGFVMKCSVDGCLRPSVVAAGQGSPGTIRVASSDLYWTVAPNSGPSAIMKCAKGTCAKPATLASFSGMPLDMDVNSSAVFWTAQQSPAAIMKCPLGGCASPDTLVTDVNYPGRIAVNSANAYWVEANDPGSIARCPVSGCPQPIPFFAFTMSTLYPYGIAVDADGVYFTVPGDSNVMRCPLTTCLLPTPVANGQTDPADIALDATNVYWINNSSPATVMKCPLGGCGSSAITVASQQNAPSFLAVGTNALFWANVDGSIVKVAK
jgi:hypothetical protein